MKLEVAEVLTLCEINKKLQLDNSLLHFFGLVGADCGSWVFIQFCRSTFLQNSDRKSSTGAHTDFRQKLYFFALFFSQLRNKFFLVLTDHAKAEIYNIFLRIHFCYVNICSK